MESRSSTRKSARKLGERVVNGKRQKRSKKPTKIQLTHAQKRFLGTKISAAIDAEKDFEWQAWNEELEQKFGVICTANAIRDFAKKTWPDVKHKLPSTSRCAYNLNIGNRCPNRRFSGMNFHKVPIIDHVLRQCSITT